MSLSSQKQSIISENNGLQAKSCGVYDNSHSTHKNICINLKLHPNDYKIIETAAKFRGIGIEDFIEITVYLCAKEIIFQTHPFIDILSQQDTELNQRGEN
ncbi:hypothetical protein ACFO6X_14005 [Giesbergeria sinuosa]|uniref:Uncharacterized protein n=1 Tax=Giesbergeria sinuosa TaxID=80883 RepID=A0ABV9QH01_9BURK